MKNIILILSFVAISGNLFSQQIVLTPGQCLQKSANWTYLSLTFGAASVVPFLLPDLGKNKLSDINPTYRPRSINYCISGGLGAISLFCYINGVRYIKLAGKQMEIQSTSNTIGLAINF